ncbi:MAG: ATP-binding protein [Lactobacillaceae bacterium]|jgi:predicted AAA+ superfamily ATPase|nr:ATP-binding protein [Lactobacillaceae bacterium]
MIIRESYLEQIRPYIDKEAVKIITGVRRTGKSVLLTQIRDEILSRVEKEQIVYINFESLMYSELRDDENAFYAYLRERFVDGKKMYFFFDEIQLAKNWERVVNSLRVDLDSDIYITGSNSSILSGELATLLSGRYKQFEILPFSFKEFIEANPKYTVEKRERALDEYLNFGGMPILSDYYEEDDQIKLDRLSDIYDSIILRDVVQRLDNPNQTTIEKTALVLMDSISSPTSVSGLVKKFPQFKNDKGISNERFSLYLNSFRQAYIFYELESENIRGGQRIRSETKFYVVDNGLWSSQVNGLKTNLGPKLENVVFLELKRRGYKLYIGHVNDNEIDFVAERNGNKEYFQVAYRLPKDSNREVGNLEIINDNYPKTLLVYEFDGVSEIDGINIKAVSDWLLEI